MPVIEATNETYRQIIGRPGLTLVMYDDLSDRSHCNVRKIWATYRKIGRLHGGRMQVVLVDRDRFDDSLAHRPIERDPMFHAYRDGTRIDAHRRPVLAVDTWLIRWAVGFLSAEDGA
ncbi:MAG: hypothetical protein ACLQVF_44910 [Isosphaeraceae bacterium]